MFKHPTYSSISADWSAGLMVEFWRFLEEIYIVLGIRVACKPAYIAAESRTIRVGMIEPLAILLSHNNNTKTGPHRSS